MEAPPYSAALEGRQIASQHAKLIPNRIFVGGLSQGTTERDLFNTFSEYGNVKSTRIILNDHGISKRYGFVTFETEEEAHGMQVADFCVVLNGRQLIIAPAFKKTPITTNRAELYTPTGTFHSNMNMEQFAPIFYQPVANMSVACIQTAYPYNPSPLQYQPMYQHYGFPTLAAPNVNATENFQGVDYNNSMRFN